jgi:Flp pilus assembly pilin Flp
MESITRYIGRFIREDEGQDVVEYGLLIVGIAFVVLVGVNAFGGSLNSWFGSIAKALPSP